MDAGTGDGAAYWDHPEHDGHLDTDQVAAESVDGRQLLADLEAFIGGYVVFPSRHCLIALCLWVVHTWVLSAFYVTPRLILHSPEPSCGKTRVLELLESLCHDARMTFSTTPAALYHSIDVADDHPPTVLHDEVDTVFGTSGGQAEDLRALYNTGYKRGATVDRLRRAGGYTTVYRSKVFAPVALAGLSGTMPSTITTRAITIHMRRRAPGEITKPYRHRTAVDEAAPLRSRLQAWGEQNLPQLIEADPKMPDGVEDRPAEIWEPLLAIADRIGGDCPDRARAACTYFVFDTDTDCWPSLRMTTTA